MDENTFIKQLLDYTDGVLELDPIGSSDLRTDFVNYGKMKRIMGEFTNVSDTWRDFNINVVQPVYGITIPAV